MTSGMRNESICTRLFLVAGGEVKCAVAAYVSSRGEEGLKIAEWLTVAFHLFIGAPSGSG